MVASRRERPLTCGAQRDALLGARTAANGTEHLPPRQNQLHRPTYLAGRHRRQGLMRPWTAFASESAAGKVGDHAHLVRREAEIARDGIADARYALRRLIQRQRIAVPLRDRTVHLHRIVIFERRHIGLVDRHRGPGKPPLHVPPPNDTLAAQWMHILGPIDRCLVPIEHGMLALVRDTHELDPFTGMLERVGHDHANRLPVVPHDVILQHRGHSHRHLSPRRGTLCSGIRSAVPRPPIPVPRMRSGHRCTRQTRCVEWCENFDNAWRLLGDAAIHCFHAALGDRARDDDGMHDVRDRILGCVARRARHFQTAIDAIERRTNAVGATFPFPVPCHAVTSVNARTSVRLARRTLNALSRCGFAFASAASAAIRKTCSLGCFPISACSASAERQGFAAMPPSPTRASRIVPPCTSTATAAEARANAKLARSRTLRYSERRAAGRGGRSMNVIRSPGCRVVSRSGCEPGRTCSDANGMSRSPSAPRMATVAHNAMSATARSPGYVAMQWSLVPRTASVRLMPAMAIAGINRTEAVLGTSDHCIATYPGDLAVALIALCATVAIRGADGERDMPFASLHVLPGSHPERETTLQPGDLITFIDLPPLPAARRSLYLKVRDRASFAFALASAAVAVDVQGGTIRDARVGLGGIAAKPWRSAEAEHALIGKHPSEQVFRMAADAALAKAKPHRDNAFKVLLAKRTLVRALTEVTA